jgi:hypothetical protein
MRSQPVDPPPDWPTVRDTIDGEVVLPKSPAYGRVHQPSSPRSGNVPTRSAKPTVRSRVTAARSSSVGHDW